MKLIIKNQTIEIENNHDGAKQVMEIIRKQTVYPTEILDYLVINDNVVENDYESYLLNNIENIREIQAEFTSLLEVVKTTFYHTEDILNKLISLSDVISVTIYDQSKNESMQRLSNLIEAVQGLNYSLGLINSLPNLNEVLANYEEWELFMSCFGQLVDKAIDLAAPIQFEDFVAIRDIVFHEIKPIIEKMLLDFPVLKQ